MLPNRRAGDYVLVAAADAWLDYRWWTVETATQGTTPSGAAVALSGAAAISPSGAAAAPSFARMVDIHRKPGYDPLELFWDRPSNGTVQDASRVRGSHGRVSVGEAVIAADGLTGSLCDATGVAEIVIRLLVD
jgi:hypothetical protein